MAMTMNKTFKWNFKLHNEKYCETFQPFVSAFKLILMKALSYGKFRASEPGFTLYISNKTPFITPASWAMPSTRRKLHPESCQRRQHSLGQRSDHPVPGPKRRKV